METFVTMHSWVRWLVLLGLVAAVGLGISRHLEGVGRWEPAYYRAAVIALDFQVLLGFILYVGNEGHDQGTFIAVFHPMFMLLALASAHLGLRFARTHQDAAPDRVIGYSYFVSVVLIVAGIPWDRLGS